MTALNRAALFLGRLGWFLFGRLRRQGEQGHLPKGLPRDLAVIQSIKAELDRDAVDEEAGVVVMVVGRIESQGQLLGVLLEGGCRNTAPEQVFAVEKNVDVDSECETKLENLLSVVAVGVKLGELRAVVVHCRQGCIAAAGRNERGAWFALGHRCSPRKAGEVGCAQFQDISERQQFVDGERFASGEHMLEARALDASSSGKGRSVEALLLGDRAEEVQKGFGGAGRHGVSGRGR